MHGHLHLIGNNTPFDSTVTISLIATDGKGKPWHVPSSIDFGIHSLCGQDSARIVVTNIGCDSLSIVALEILGDTDFIAGSVPITALLPGDSLEVPISLDPNSIGDRRAKLIVRYLDGTVDTIPLQATVIRSSMLDVSPTAIDFGTSTICEERTSAVHITNTGCDTVILTTASLKGSGYVVTSALPIIIPPQGAADISIETSLDTTAGSTANNSVLTLLSNADNPSIDVSLVRKFEYPPAYDVRMVILEPRATSGDTIRIDLIETSPNSTVTMTGVTQLDFDLPESDLLQFLYHQSPNNVLLNGSHVTINGSPEVVASAGVISSFYYIVRLTRDSTLAISPTAMMVNSGGSPCDPTLIQSGAIFTYQYLCGDRTIRKFLKNELLFSIVSISQNPTTEEVKIELESVTKDPIRVAVVDVLGNTVQAFETNTKEVLLPTHGFSSGYYSVMLTSQGHTVIGKFVLRK